jgi:hypothetical protein
VLVLVLVRVLVRMLVRVLVLGAGGAKSLSQAGSGGVPYGFVLSLCSDS